MDRVLFQMPNDPLEFFYAMCIVQGYVFEYVQEVKHLQREQRYQFVYRMDERYSKYEAPLKVAAENTPVFDYTGWNQFARSEFQCIIDFDFERAKKLATNSGKHIVEALGIMYGCTPRRWPILPPPECKQGKGVLIVDWTSETDEADKVAKAIGPNVHLIRLSKDYKFEDLEIETAEAVIAPVSVISYLAATYARKVIEIFPDMQSYYMYNNARISYQAIIGNPSTDDVLQAWYGMSQVEEDYAILDQA